MLKTIYLFELKKLFLAKVNLIALIGSVMILVFLAFFSISEDQPALREAAQVLDGRTVDGTLFEELKPALKYENGLALLQVKEGCERYIPILNMIMSVSGDGIDLSRFQGMGFYELRRLRILQRLEKQGITEEEKEYWDALENKVQKPFVYHYLLGLLIPFSLIFGMEGTGEMLQFVKPLSMLPYTIDQMLMIYSGIFLLAAVMSASITMMLSVITQNTLTVTCGLLGYLIVDLFAVVPERFRLLQTVWSLRPNAILMNTGFVNYRLIHIAGRLFMCHQAVPVIYAAITAAAFLIGRWKYPRHLC